MVIILCMISEIWSATDRISFNSGLFFAPLPSPLWTQKIKIFKRWKNVWRYYHLTHVYHTSYDVWFLRRGVWQTEFFVILENFLPFYPPKNQKKSKFWKIKRWKKALEISFYTSDQKSGLYGILFLGYGTWQM